MEGRHSPMSKIRERLACPDRGRHVRIPLMSIAVLIVLPKSTVATRTRKRAQTGNIALDEELPCRFVDGRQRALAYFDCSTGRSLHTSGENACPTQQYPEIT